MIRAWRYRRGERGSALVSARTPLPPLTDDAVLVAVEASALGPPDLDRPARAAREEDAAPVTPGGAAVGRVIDTGDGATELRGRRVIVPPELGCGECDVCRRGGVSVCPRGATLGWTADGTLATHVVSRGRWVLALDEPDAGALCVPGPAAALLGREAAWAYAMYAHAGVAPGQPVAIIGEDVVARFLLDVAVAMGTRPVVVVDAPEPWVEARGGVAVVVRDDDGDWLGFVRDRVHAAGAAAGRGDEPWHVFETGARDGGRRAALAVAGPLAQVTLLSRRAMGYAHGPPLDIEQLLDGGGALRAVTGAHPDLLPEVAALAVRGELDLDAGAEVVTEAALDRVYERVDDADQAGRALVVTVDPDWEPGTEADLDREAGPDSGRGSGARGA